MTQTPETADLEERIEAQLWAGFLSNHSNPLLRDGAAFLSEYYDLEVDYPACTVNECVKCSADQFIERDRWSDYLANHSLAGLRELSEWLEEWHSSLNDA